MTHYDTLGVPRDADSAAIKRAYRKKSRAAHPDKGGDHTAMVAVNRAFDTLSDPEKRARYDATGEDDKPQRGIDDQARDAVMQIFTALLDRLGDGDNALEAVARQLAHNLAQIRGSIATAEKRITRLERARKRLKAKRKTARNFLADLLTDQITQTRMRIEDTKRAAQLVKRCEFMPTPKDFEDLRRAGAKTTGEAWLLARQAWRSGAVTCGDERIDRVVAMLGGYALLGQTRTDQLQFIERRFAEHYESLAEAEEVREALPALMASAERRVERLR